MERLPCIVELYSEAHGLSVLDIPRNAGHSVRIEEECLPVNSFYSWSESSKLQNRALCLRSTPEAKLLWVCPLLRNGEINVLYHNILRQPFKDKPNKIQPL